jgi:hypothetical protein
VAEAFAAVLGRARSSEAHGRWIPVEYWLTKINHDEDDVVITPGKFVAKLQKDLNRELTLEDDSAIHCATLSGMEAR